MEKRQLGQTQIHVSVIALGGWPIVGGANWGDQDEADSLATIETALDAGINFFDTAPSYGNGYSETLLGRTLKHRRDHAVIATKVPPTRLRYDDLIASCNESLERLATDYIDLLQIHWPNRDVPFDEPLAAMDALRKQGKIRAIGVSNFGPRDMRDAMRITRIESNQLAYSLLARMIEHDIQPLCVDNKMSILPYSPLMQGLLTGKFRSPDDVPQGRARTRHFSSDRPQARHGEPGCETQTFNAIERIRQISDELNVPMDRLALAWCLHRPGVPSVLAGARNPQQVRANAAAADLMLDQSTLDALDRATAPVMAALGSDADLWERPSRIR